MSLDENNLLLKEILSTLKRIENKMDKNDLASHSSSSLDIMEILSTIYELDNSLYPTIKALLKLGGNSTAQEVAINTKRSRSRENQHLNRLVELGYIIKRREGREIFFSLNTDVKVRESL